MNDFDYENMLKKKLAKQVLHRTGTRGRKGCSLPSDNLTKKEREKMNGEVKTIKMNAPMTWKEFIKLSDDIQREYLIGLEQKYQPTAEMLGKMFGISRKSITLRRKVLGLSHGYSGRNTHPKPDYAGWDAFLMKGRIEEVGLFESENTVVDDDAAKKILADAAGGNPNDTTNDLTTKLIFGNNGTPQKEPEVPDIKSMASLRFKEVMKDIQNERQSRSSVSTIHLTMDGKGDDILNSLRYILRCFGDDEIMLSININKKTFNKEDC